MAAKKPAARKRAAAKPPLDLEAARRAVELRLAGVPYPQIAERCGFDSAAGAAEAVRAALELDVPETPELVRRQEIERLDAMLTGLWAAARRGDTGAVDRVMRLTERRARLLNAGGGGQLRAAFDETVVASEQVRPVDEALVAAGRKIADRVDDAVAMGEGQDVTKALYLLPHLTNILRELLATPAARSAAGMVEATKGGKLAQLRAVHGDTPRRTSAG